MGANLPLCWLHLGDLHADEQDGFESLQDLQQIVTDSNRYLSWALDFAYLPGDNANHGAPQQYERITAVLKDLELPFHAIPGDHDFEPGSLHAYSAALGDGALPKSIRVKGRRCLFLDIVSAGDGGPDFRLGQQQTDWLRRELTQSRSDAYRPVVFMHAFPGDLHEGADEVGQLFAEHSVAFVDTGHTHYNELLNDGFVIYAATRSTGQVEEGPVGFSIGCVDGSVASWTFKNLNDPWPLVLITSPADHRLITDPAEPDQMPTGTFEIRAKVFGETVHAVELCLAHQEPVAMVKVDGAVGLWRATADGLSAGLHDVIVRARAGDWATQDTIRISVGVGARPTPRPPRRHLGHDLHSVGAWPDHGLLGTQLGPNKNGKKW